MANYYSIEPIKAFVLSSALLQEYDDYSIPCEIIALSVYEGESITFVIKLSDGEVFSYIPPTKVFTLEIPLKEYELKDLVYFNSPSTKIEISILNSLKGECSCFIRDMDSWVAGEYILTVDFPEENELFNMIILEDGNIAFLPFHKVKFKKMSATTKAFKPFKKQRETYIV